MAVFENPDFTNLPQPLASLFAKAAERSFFALPIWYHVLFHYGTGKGAVPRLYADDEDRPRAALVCQAPKSGSHRLLSLSNYYSTEYGPLYAAGEQHLAEAFGVIARQIRAGRWAALRLAGLDPEDAAFAPLAEAFAKDGFAVYRYFDSGTWYENTAGLDFARYVEARPAALRNTWRRKSQKLNAEHKTEFVFHDDAARIEDAVEDYQRVYRTSWKGAEPYAEFMPQLIRAAAQVGALRLGVLKADGEAAAAQCWILWRGRATIYKLAHDARFNEHSPGTLLTMAMMERVLERDRPREVDFGRGDDGYKKLWLGQRRERWGLVIANRQTLGGLVVSGRESAARMVKRLIRR